MKTYKTLKRQLAILACLALSLSGGTALAETLQRTETVSADNTFAINQELNRNIDTVKHLKEGSITVDFSTTDANGVGALFSASDTTVDSRNLTLAVVKGHLYWEVRDNQGNKYDSKLDAEDAWVADGLPHQAVVSVNSDGTRLFLDGQMVYSTTANAFLNKLTAIDRIAVGSNQDMNGVEWKFSGKIIEAKIYPKPLTEKEIFSAFPKPKAIAEYSMGDQHIDSLTHEVLSSRKTTILFNIPATQNKTEKIATLYRGATAVQILEYSDNTLILSQGGKRIIFSGDWKSRSHIVAVSIFDNDLKIYADGTLIGKLNLASDSFNTIDRVEVNTGKLKIFAGNLNEPTVQTLSNYTRPAEQPLFDIGYNGAASYRIPSLLLTKQGTLIAAADQRVASACDSPNDINLVLRRSKDQGKSWGQLQTVIDLPGTGKQAASVIDSTLVQNDQTGRITIVVDLFPGGYGQPNNKSGIGLDNEGNLELFGKDGSKYINHSDGRVTTPSGQRTNYNTDSRGDVFLTGKKVGNYYAASGSSLDTKENLTMWGTSYLVTVHSDDDGKTWSKPRFISNQVKESWMKFLGTGPGSAICLKNGSHAGRLIVPVYYSNLHNVYSSAVIYSDDDGKTWHRSISPNDVRKISGRIIGSKDLTQRNQSLHESTVVQTAPNELMMFMRNLNPGSRIGKSRSNDGGETWTAPVFDSDVADIFSQPNAISMGEPNGNIVFANASANPGYRGWGVIRHSLDGGRSWAQARTFNSGHYVYQSMTILPSGDIGLLWEREWQGLYFSVIPKRWLTDSPVNIIR